MRRSRRTLLLLPLVAVALAGCRSALIAGFGPLGQAVVGSVGAKFNPIQGPRDKAVVYIYRVGLWEPRGFFGAGPCPVRSGDETVADLSAGEYRPYLAEPGEREFSSRVGAFHVSITEHLRAGETYYLKAGNVYGYNPPVMGLARPTLLFVTRDVGEREIRECHLPSE